MRKYLFVFLLVSVFMLHAGNKSINPSQGNSTWNSTLSSGLSAGDTVFMEDGVYTDFQVTFKGTGTEQNPIVLRARNYGKVTIEGQINVKLSGQYLVVDGLHFRNGWAKNTDPASTSDVFEFRTNSTTFAYNSRLTNCVFDSLNNPDKSPTNANQTERWVMLYGKNNRIDNCYFGYKDRGGVMIMIDIRDVNSQENDHIIERNFFGKRPKYSPGNGAETIRPGDSDRSLLSSRCTIRENVFYHCDGEIEIVSLKSCDNVVANNVFIESQGMVVCRHGHGNIIESNVFLGNDVSNCGGVRVINSNHKIYNNLFQELKGTGTRSALCVMTGFDDSAPLNSYYQVKNVDIAFNTFVNCASIEMSTESSYDGLGKGPLAPVNTKFWNNIIYNESLSSAYIDKGNTSGIDFKGNLYKIKPSASFSKDGFAIRDMHYLPDSKGVYYMKAPEAGYCMPSLFSYGNLSYITHDLTGNPRNGHKDVGAINLENIRSKYNIPSVDAVGVSWYNYAKPTY